MLRYALLQGKFSESITNRCIRRSLCSLVICHTILSFKVIKTRNAVAQFTCASFIGYIMEKVFMTGSGKRDNCAHTMICQYKCCCSKTPFIHFGLGYLQLFGYTHAKFEELSALLTGQALLKDGYLNKWGWVGQK